MSNPSVSSSAESLGNPRFVLPPGTGQIKKAETSSAAEVELIEILARTKIAHCYQCGKCTAGCPVAEQMEMGPTKLIRFMQIGSVDKALRSNSIWQCVSCLTCSSRCPKEVDCAALMDALRELSLQQGKVSPQAQQIVTFQRAFLDNIRRNGRLNEFDLIARFKSEVAIGTRQLSFLFKDASLALQLRKRKKLHFGKKSSADLDVVARIFARCVEDES